MSIGLRRVIDIPDIFRSVELLFDILGNCIFWLVHFLTIVVLAKYGITYILSAVVCDIWSIQLSYAYTLEGAKIAPVSASSIARSQQEK